MDIADKPIDEARVPYQLPFPPDARSEIILPDVFGPDERLWVPQAEGVHFKPLCLNTTQGYYINLLRVRKSGVLSRHRHAGPVHAQVMKGKWYYLEHDWVAEAGSYIMEAPGETHTLVVPDGVDEMITWFHVTGGYVYVDPHGKAVGYEDVFTKIDRTREHYLAQGFGEDVVQRLIR